MTRSLAILPTSFRGQLFAVMTTLIAVAIFGVVTITQHRIAMSYRRMFNQQFLQQLAFVSQTLQLRFNGVLQQSKELAGSVRLLAAFEEGDGDNLYRVAADELALRNLMPSADDNDKNRNPVFFRFVTQDAALVPGTGTEAGLVDGPYEPALKSKLGQLLSFMRRGDNQALGYMLLDASTANSGYAPLLLEVAITKVVDPDSDRMFGALVIGFPAKVEKTSGVVVDGRLFTEALEGPIRLALEHDLAGPLTDGSQKGEFLFKDPSETLEILYLHLTSLSIFGPAYQLGFFSRSAEMEERREMLFDSVALGGLILVVSLCISALLASKLSNPIRQLVAGTSRIRAGTFDTPVPIVRLDELGRLSEAFNEMTADLALKEKYRNVLDVIADKNVAHALLKGDIKLGGESCAVSVLFCDIRGFTALTERMDPNQVIELLNDHMTVLTKMVYDHGGVVDKFVGDLIMAVFGVPHGSPDDPMNAASCALGMMERRAALNQSGKLSFEIGIGVATGNVVAGCMGSADRLNYTVLGERVNLASRLCSAAAPKQILVDDATFQAIGGDFVCDERPPGHFKGFSDALRTFSLVGTA